MEAAQKSAKTIKNVLDNVYVSGAIKIFIILYAVLAAPKLPSWIAKLFHHSVFQVVVFALIAYTATKDVGISLLIAVAFFVSFHAYTRHLLNKVANKSKDALGMVYKTDGVLESNYGKSADDGRGLPCPRRSAEALEVRGTAERDLGHLGSARAWRSV